MLSFQNADVIPGKFNEVKKFSDTFSKEKIDNNVI
jgi:hypothetical protein